MSDRQAWRLANRYLHKAGILKPPPRLWAAVEEAGLRLLAEAWLGFAEEHLALKDQRTRELDKLERKYETRITGLASDIQSGISDNTLSIKYPEVGFSDRGVRWPKEPSEMKEGEIKVELDYRGNWKLMVRRPRKVLELIDDGMAQYELLDELVKYRRRMVDVFEELREAYVNPKSYAVLRDIALKYGAKEGNASKDTSRSVVIPVDLTGWAHAPKNPVELPPVRLTMVPETHSADGEWVAEYKQIRFYVGKDFKLPLLEGQLVNSFFGPADADVVMRSVRQVLMHETVHAAQTILQIVHGLALPAGLPKNKAREPGYLDNPNAWGSGGWSLAHPRRDIEFHTRLTDEVADFLREWPLAVAKAARKGTDLDRRTVFTNWLKESEFFSTNKSNKAKWRDAVGKFLAELERQGWELQER